MTQRDSTLPSTLIACPVMLRLVRSEEQGCWLESLRSTPMSADHVPMLLGFSDTANFRRPLERWTGIGLGGPTKPGPQGVIR